MDNLIKINDDLVVMDNIPVHFKNYVVGSYSSKETICMVYLWDTYIMTLDEAFYIARGAEMEEQFDFIKGIIQEELILNSEQVSKMDEIILQFPFVTAKIWDSKINGWCVIVEEISDNGVINHLSEVVGELEQAKSIAVSNSFKISKSIQAQKNTEAWQNL
ncbi:MAG: hypothetical protein P8N43_00115 [Alphaproteobacteria bacterium]|nr:hypothetical protein [Alphaproteobacteria bacterium]